MNGLGGFDLRFTWICCLCCCGSFYLEKHNFFFLLLSHGLGHCFQGPGWTGPVEPAGPGGVGLGPGKKFHLINGPGPGRES